MTAPRINPRASFRDLIIHDGDPPPCEFALADNTSAYGLPPAARDSLTSAAFDDLSQYPTTYSARLCEAFARYVGVSADEVAVGAGSDEMIGCALRALAEPGATMAHMHPTFVMTPAFATINSLRPVAIPLSTDDDADADSLVRARCDLTYVCTPNNPTGLAIAPSRLAHLVEQTSGLLLVDEAYAEFAGSNLAALAPAHGRMIVFRTMSKAWGMAGLRVGFAVGARELIGELRKARGPFTVAALSERAATAALAHDAPWVTRAAQLTCAARDRFAAALQEAGFRPFPSAANFVLLRVADAASSHRALLERGVLVRPFRALPGIGDAIRITVGHPDIMPRVLERVLASVRPA